MAELETWKSRLITERDELFDRLTKLKSFLFSEKFMKLSEDDRNDMTYQYSCMLGYLVHLQNRMERLGLTIKSFEKEWQKQ